MVLNTRQKLAPSDNSFIVLCMSQNNAVTYQFNPADHEPWEIINPYDCDGTITTSVSEVTGNNNQAAFYPNPFSESAFLTVNEEMKNATLEVYDIIGQQISVQEVNGQVIKLYKGSLPAGHYYYKLAQNYRLISTGKFIVE